MVETGGLVRRSPWLALAVLFAVYTLNYLDRSLIYILFKPIKAELHLGDTQLALLGATAFVILYTLLGVPFGRLADRRSRVMMIAGGLLVWSVASSLTGLAGGFGTLLLCRVMVGVGEATLGPAAYSLIADLFPKERRATASALFAAGIPLGAGLAMLVGGAIGKEMGWRAAFPLLGIPGVVLAIAVPLLIAEPDRTASPKAEAAPSDSMLTVLRRSNALRWHVLGYATLAIASNALSMWVPSFLAARFDRDIGEVGMWVGGAALVGGLIGTCGGGFVADALERRFAGGRLAFGSLMAMGSVLAWLIVLQCSTPAVAILGCTLGMMCGLAWLGPASADVQDLVGAEHRGSAIALYYLVVNLAGYGLGAPVIGALNDATGHGLWLCPVVCTIAAGMLALGSYTRAAPAVDAWPLPAGPGPG